MSDNPPPPPPGDNGETNDKTGDDDGQSDDANVASREQLQKLRQADRAKAQRVKELEAELAKLSAANLSDHEKAIAEAVKAKDEEWSSRYLALRIERLAATRLRDPADSRLLDAEFKADATDEDIISALEKLIASKPYLGPEDASKRTPPPLDQGVRNGGRPPAGTDMNALIRSGRR